MDKSLGFSMLSWAKKAALTTGGSKGDGGGFSIDFSSSVFAMISSLFPITVFSDVSTSLLLLTCDSSLMET